MGFGDRGTGRSHIGENSADFSVRIHILLREVEKFLARDEFVVRVMRCAYFSTFLLTPRRRFSREEDDVRRIIGIYAEHPTIPTVMFRGGLATIHFLLSIERSRPHLPIRSRGVTLDIRRHPGRLCPCSRLPHLFILLLIIGF